MDLFPALNLVPAIVGGRGGRYRGGRKRWERWEEGRCERGERR